MKWKRFIAVGDSFTEGLSDGTEPHYRGWADRFAGIMARTTPELQYANLAVRGRKLADIINRQLPLALDQNPDLVSIAGGINDALRPSWNVSATAERLRAGVASVRSTGADVLLFAFGELRHRSRLLGLADGRVAEYRELTLEIADDYDCHLVDFAPVRVFDDARFWAQDRLHLNEVGHERVSWLVAETVDFEPPGDWREPLGPTPDSSILTTLTADAVWTAQHLTPWVTRRLQRRSSGDGVHAKQPVLTPVTARTPASL